MNELLDEVTSTLHEYALGNYQHKITAISENNDTIVADITTLQEQLKSTESNKEEFMENIAHELRGPLSAITLIVNDLCNNEEIAPQSVTNSLHTIQGETARMNAVITTMLRLGQLENGQITPNFSWFSLGDIINRTFHLFTRQLEVRAVKVKGINNDGIRVWGDADLMGQIIFNLVENAVKNVSKRGTIDVSYKLEDGTWEMAIRNTGNGIPQEELPHIFERFYRASTSSHYIGLGIGLNLAERLMKINGGTLTIESDGSSYSTFTLRATLPSAETQN